MFDSELLALLVEMAAFQAQRFGGVSHFVIMLLELGGDDFSFVDVHPLRKRSGAGGKIWRARIEWQGETGSGGIDAIIGQQ